MAQNIALVALQQRTVMKALHVIFTVLRVWGSEFGIPNHYTGFKIALDTEVDDHLAFLWDCLQVSPLIIGKFTGIN